MISRSNDDWTNFDKDLILASSVYKIERERIFRSVDSSMGNVNRSFPFSEMTELMGVVCVLARVQKLERKNSSFFRQENSEPTRDERQ